MADLPPELPRDLERCHEIIRELARDLQSQRNQLEWLKRKLFGKLSERFDPADLTFFGEKPEEPPAEEKPQPEERDEPDKAAPARKGHGRQALPKDLPRKRIEHDVDEAGRACPCCGGQRKRIGEDVSEQLEYIPASVYVIEHVRPKYACPRCQEGVAQAPMPPAPIDKGLAGPGLLAHVITSKYCDHLPLHRQEAILARQGVGLSRKTLCDWMMACADALEPVALAMKKAMLASAAINADETPVPVQDKTATHRAYLWTYLGDAEHPCTVYDFTWTRNAEGPKNFLKGFQGHLQADAYAGYDALYAAGDVIEVGCWAHARRKIFESKTSSPVQAAEGLLRVRALYEIEREAAALPSADLHLFYEKRRELRQARARPLLESFAQWLAKLKERVLPKSPMGEAIGYALSNWTALTRYLDDGRLAIDNNAAERALRGVVIGRKNWLFAGSARGGHAAAILYSLVASAKRNGIDPFAYLRDLLRRVPTHPHSRINELLPDAWKDLQASGKTLPA